jgi:hypothetical protein
VEEANRVKQATVTGATGLIGRELCARLHEQGVSLTVVGRDAERAKRAFSFTVQAVAWSDNDGLRRAVREADTVFHLAGASVAGKRWTPDYKEKLWTSRQETTRRIAECQPRDLVCASAVGYYGGQGNTVLTEDSPPGDDFLARLCVAWEQTAERVRDNGGTTSLLRTGIVLAQKDSALQTMIRPSFLPVSPWKVGLGGPIGNGKQWMPWVHLTDVAGLFAWSANKNETYNVVAPNPVTGREFARALGRMLRRPSVFAVPGFALRLLVGEFAHFLLYSQRVVPTRALRDGYSFRYTNIGDALHHCAER